MKWLLLLFLLPVSAQAQQLQQPRFTSASVNSTTTTTQTIDEVIAHEIFGGATATWSGTNVKPNTADITNSNTTWDIVTAGEDFQLEVTSRAAGIIETIDIERTIETESTTTTLSVFSQ
jgi:hypothetical protein|tara:strand:+ start:2076 stop:2432 length:357 start_codon:yes stop_codon:yes gene_type:complete